jgi:phosphoadenosine phosphosulfate reductase
VKASRLPGDESTPLLVAYSGGKDSLVVMDLCVRAGRKLSAYMLCFLPGMDYAAHWCEYARRRWGVEVRQYQDPNTIRLLRAGRFRLNPMNVVAITSREVEALARRESGCEWIGYGYKAVDSIDRRVMLKTWPDGIHEGWKKFAPVAGWRHADVLAYLSRRRIDIPPTVKAGMSGIGLGPFSLAFMRANWPGDYRRIIEVFPFAEAQADRAAEIRERKQRNRAERQTSARQARAALANQRGGIQPAVNL